jgi:hypothetical protein
LVTTESFWVGRIAREDDMRLQTVVRMNGSVDGTKHAGLTGLLNRFGSGRFARTPLRALPSNDGDPYLLILLADQELDAGRKDQAGSLIEAVYQAFDQRTDAQVYRIHPMD